MKKVAAVLLMLFGMAVFSSAYACDGKGDKAKMPSGPVSTPSGTTGT
jgi:hypothetical protein